MNAVFHQHRHGIYFVLVSLLLVVGASLLLLGVHYHTSTIFGKTELTVRSLSILTDSNASTINEIEIFVDNFRMTAPEEGWANAVVDFTSDCEHMALYLTVPREIRSVGFINHSRYEILSHDWEYHDDSDVSSIFLSYVSFANKSHFRINFDWNILERISYDRESVTISFDNPFFGKIPLFSEPVPFASFFIPKIRRLIIEIESNLTLDSSLTYPEPSYLYFSDGKPSVCWAFGPNREVSSVEAVFQDLSLTARKNSRIFWSGILMAFGVSMIIGGVREIMSHIKG